MNKFIVFLKGLAMGFADVIPGVSGGTIAFITGIYNDFIEAIKSVNIRWLAPLLAWVFSGFSRDKRAAFLEPLLAIHWHFIIPLGIGIVASFGVGSVVVPHLMDTYPVETATFFIGLIAASVVVPWRQMTRRTWKHLLYGVAAALLTYLSLGAKVEPVLSWSTQQQAEAATISDFMRQHPSVRNAEELYCPARAGQDNAALRAAIANDAEQPGVAAHLDDLCARIEATRLDLQAATALRADEHLGRKDRLNPFNNAMVPAGTPVEIPAPHYWYIFMSGFISICAMVLPGISGSFFLLVLGVYNFMLSSALKGFISNLVHGHLPVTQSAYVIVFALGALIGILSFSRVMSWLFRRFPDTTLAVLIGMMLGSLRTLWPWKIGEPHTGVANVMPPEGSSLVVPVLTLVVGAVIVLAMSVVDPDAKKKAA